MNNIDDKIIIKIANKLKIEEALIYSIIKVESNGKFKLEDGKITILFERHVFYKLLKRKFGRVYAREISKKYPNICSYRAGGYGKYSAQYARLARAIKIDKEIAHQSTSFGAFQTMGFNYKLCGYHSAVEMSDLYHFEPMEQQIYGFINFVKNSNNGKLWKALEDKDFAKVAKLYNGRAYKKNKYDEKLRKFYIEYVLKRLSEMRMV